MHSPQVYRNGCATGNALGYWNTSSYTSSASVVTKIGNQTLRVRSPELLAETITALSAGVKPVRYGEGPEV